MHRRGLKGEFELVSIPMEREFDLVVFGATGFTGELVAEYLATVSAERLPRAGLRWALAGRSETKLAAVRAKLADRLGPAAAARARLPAVVVVDAADAPALAALAARARAIVTTVGPYLRYGGPLVAACVNDASCRGRVGVGVPVRVVWDGQLRLR